MHQSTTNGQGEIPARASGHNAIPLIEITPATNGMGGVGTSVGGVPLIGDNGTSPIVEGTLSTADTVALLKNMTPPMFKGEDWERNKDAINTYLHKWNDLHTLRNTPDSLHAIESSLNLEGKAYELYMSLNMAARTSTWSCYQEIF